MLEDEQAVLVGGQALVALTDLLELEGGLLASRDIDLVGGKRLVQRCAEILEGEATYPDSDDLTIHAGYVIFEDRYGSRRQLDVLHSLFAFNGDEVRRHALSVGDILILHPLHALRDKVAQLGVLRSDDILLEQVRVAIRAVAAFTLHLLDDQNLEPSVRLEQALRINRGVFDLAATKDGRRAHRDFGVDVLDAVVGAHPLIPVKTRELEYAFRRRAIGMKRSYTAIAQRLGNA